MSKQISNRHSGFRTLLLLLLTWGAAVLMISCVSAGTGVTISADGGQSYYLGEDVVVRGLSPDADTVYLFLTGPNLPATGAQLTTPDQAVVSGNPGTFTTVRTQPDTSWEFTLHTANLPLDSGVYMIFATGEPKAKDQLGAGAASVDFIIRRPFTGVTISADGDQSYYLGEKVVLRGLSPDADIVYLFLTGPNLPATGASLMSPDKAAVSGNPGTFTSVKTQSDKTWTYAWYTSGLRLDAGTYTLYAVGQPNATDQLGPGAANVGIIIKKPFISGAISAPDIVQGQSFTVIGIAEGIPPYVRIWIFGNNYAYTTVTPVYSDASFTFDADATLSGKIPTGQNYLIVDHPMADNQSDFEVGGDYIRQNNSTNLFRITGPGSLQGGDAADALIAAISGGEAHDHTYTNDTYTIIPFRVTAAGTTTSLPPAATTVPTEKPVVIIVAQGEGSYYLGERVVLSGRNTGSDSTYLFLTGPNLPANGASLMSPDKAAVSGNPDSFTTVKTQPDTTWTYPWYTSGLKLDAGSYTLYAVSKPQSEDQLAEAPYGTTSIIIKKPFIMGAISPATVSRGQPFTVTGTAEGDPPEVRIWIFGDNYAYTTTTPVRPDTTFTFTADAALSGKLPTGQNYLIAEHPMADNQADFVVSGDFVRDLKLNGGTDIFRITGPGSLQGSDAADALIAAISEGEVHDETYTHDTYTLIPFKVTDAKSQTARQAPFENALHSLEEALRSLF